MREIQLALDNKEKQLYSASMDAISIANVLVMVLEVGKFGH